MTYLANETSVSNGQPIELFEFTTGAIVTKFTASNYTYEDYTTENITRTSIKRSTESFKDSLSIVVPINSSIATTYNIEKQTTLVIKRVHLSDADNEKRIYWAGRVLSAVVSGTDFTMECESVFTALQRMGLRARFLIGCRHELYGLNCKVVKASFSASSLATGISSDGRTITPVANDLPPFSITYFLGGMITANGENRMITAQSATTITINRKFTSIAINAPIIIYAGCNHTISDCTTKFNNLLNYGGFPYAPINSPFDGRSIV